MLAAVTTNAGSGAMTTITFVMILLGMVAALAIIGWGTMRRRAKAAEIAEAKLHADRAEHREHDAPEPPALAPVVASPEPAPEASRPVAPVVDAAPGEPLTLLKGLGPKAAARLAELGVGDVAALAALSPTEIATIDGQMGGFAGRIERDRWVEQARLLAAGDRAGFEATFGKLGT